MDTNSIAQAVAYTLGYEAASSGIVGDYATVGFASVSVMFAIMEIDPSLDSEAYHAAWRKGVAAGREEGDRARWRKELAEIHAGKYPVAIDEQ